MNPSQVDPDAPVVAEDGERVPAVQPHSLAGAHDARTRAAVQSEMRQ